MNIRNLFIASELAQLGANLGFLVENTDMGVKLAKHILKDYMVDNSKSERITLGPGFLKNESSKNEAELWWSTFCRVGNSSAPFTQQLKFTDAERMLSAYKLYKSLSTNPLSINKCFGINKAIANDVYKVSFKSDEDFIEISACSHKDKDKRVLDIEKNKHEVNKVFNTQYFLN
jgi:hypothetical protein